MRKRKVSMLSIEELRKMKMIRITGHLNPDEIRQIKVAWARKFDAQCPHCGKSIKEFGIRIKDDLFYCQKCLKYHTL
jgi:ribosomal protein L37AE/L43A